MHSQVLRKGAADAQRWVTTTRILQEATFFLCSSPPPRSNSLLSLLFAGLGKQEEKKKMKLSPLVSKLLCLMFLIGFTSAFQKWKDCGSTKTTVWGLNIEPRPQVLGENWTIYYAWVPLVDITQDMHLNVTINVMYNGTSFHKDTLSLCDTKDPVALSDGYGKCPYKTGVPSLIHDTNVIPNFPFIPTGPYVTFVTYASAGSKSNVLCVEFSQTYIRP